MIKQIKIDFDNEQVIAKMNGKTLFVLNMQNKEIKLEELYKKLDIKMDDIFVDNIDELNIENKSSIHFLYDNTKLFLSTLIMKINKCIESFDVKMEKNKLINLY